MARLKEVSLYTGGLLVTQAVGFLTGILVGRWLGPSAYGTTAVARTFYQSLLVLAPLGLDLALQKHLAEQREPNANAMDEANAARLIAFGSSAILVFACASGVAQWLGHAVYKEANFALLLIITLAALPFGADSGAMASMFRAEHRITPFIFIGLYAQQAIRFVLLFIMLALGWGVYAIVYSITISALASWMMLFIYRIRRKEDSLRAILAVKFKHIMLAPWTGAAKLLNTSSWMAMSLFTYSMLRYFDVLILGALRPAAEVGAYSALSVFAQVVQIYPFSLSQTLGPTIARLHSLHDTSAMRDAIDSYMRQASAVAAPMFAGVAVFGSSLDLLFGPKFHFSPAVAFLLPLGYFISGVLAPIGYLLSMTGRHKQEFFILIIGGVALLFGCWALVPPFGGAGAAGAVSIAFAIINGARYTYVRRLFGFLPGKVGDLIPPVMALMIAAIIQTLVKMMLGHSLFALVLASGLFVGAYALAWVQLLARPSERAYIHQRLNSVLAR